MAYITRRSTLAACLASIASAKTSFAAGAPNPGLIDAQRKALAALAIYDGAWRGSATIIEPSGDKLTLTQTERVGPFLDGTLRLIEGRGYLPDGSVAFNAFAVVSYSPQAAKYNFRSYAQGYAGDFPMEVRADGFTWSINTGPALVRYTSTVSNGTWTEIGEQIMPGREPLRTFEMTLRRVGPTPWPADGAVAR